MITLHTLFAHRYKNITLMNSLIHTTHHTLYAFNHIHFKLMAVVAEQRGNIMMKI